MFRALILLLALAACSPKPELDGQNVGNGGDLLVKLFERGRVQAERVLDAVKSLDDPRFADWYARRRDELRADVHDTPSYRWVRRNDNSACGKTGHARHSPISLSYDFCQGVHTLRDAAVHLIGESVHHLDVRDDAFTAGVAVAVAKAWEKIIGDFPSALEKRLMFDGARIHATELMMRIRGENMPLAFRTLYTAEEKAWLFANASKIAADISASDHIWVDGELSPGSEPGENCFTTAGAPLADVELSYSGCALGRREAAGQSLAEASIWHLRGDRATARRLAALAYATWFNMGHPDAAHWLTIPPHSPARRDVFQSVWTGDEMLAWSAGMRDIYHYNPRANEWTLSHAEVAVDDYRKGENPRWVAGKLVIFGECYDTEGKTGSGAMYDPERAMWAPMNRRGAPQPRWYGSPTTLSLDGKMVIFGGINSCGSKEEPGIDFAIFDPTLNVWRTKPVVERSPLARQGAVTADLGGRRLFVWGGVTDEGARSDGAIYDYDGAKLRDISNLGAPKARGWAKSVVGGGFVVMLGGFTMGDRQARPYTRSQVADGALYDIAHDLWIEMSPKEAPRFDPDKPFALLWVGDEVLYVGNSIAYFNPVRNAWRASARALTPLLKNPYRAEPQTFWTGMEAIVWDAWSYGETLSGYAYYP